MKRIRIALIVMGICLGAGPLRAQSSEKSERLPALEEEFRQTVTKQSQEMMQEHIAVFRVLLNRAVEKTYGFPMQVPGHGHGRGDAFHQMPLAEGVYLPGHGVVYSLSAPPPPGDPLARDTPGDVKELTSWERARRELRGEKVTQDTKQAAPREASLSEALLRLLAENGKNFSQLPAKERITLAVTFRSGLDCARCHQTVAARDLREARLRGTIDPLLSGHSSRQPLGSPAAQLPTTVGASPYTPDAEVKNGIMLGDLHIRQGRYAEAVKVYREALKRQLEVLAPSEKRTSADVQRLLGAGEISNRLAQALMAQGQHEEARSIMTSGLKIAEAAVKLADGLKDGTVRGVPLPAQLIVSAPKKLLEQAAGGKMSLAEFREAATVEYIRFPTAKDDKKEDKKP